MYSTVDIRINAMLTTTENPAIMGTVRSLILRFLGYDVIPYDAERFSHPFLSDIFSVVLGLVLFKPPELLADFRLHGSY